MQSGKDLCNHKTRRKERTCSVSRKSTTPTWRCLRKYGPTLFDKLITVKRSGSLKQLNTRESKVQFEIEVDRSTVLERDDLSRAIKSRDHSETELLVLRYMLYSIRRAGHFVGLESFTCLPYGDASGYYVISAEDISSYDGALRGPEPQIDRLELLLVWVFVSGSLSFVALGLAYRFPLLLTLVLCLWALGYFYARYIAMWAAERRVDALRWRGKSRHT